MSLFGGLMGIDDDPFFSGHRNMMRHIDRMMSSMMRDPFQGHGFFDNGGPGLAMGGGGGGGFPALMDSPLVLSRNHNGGGGGGGGSGPRHPSRQHHRDPFPNIMSSMEQMSGQGNCQMFSSSSVMTMSTGPDGRPQVYQATSSTRGVPGGVKETRRTISDSRTGTRKMAIGHHIGDRAHIIEKEQQGSNLEERQELINLDESEAPEFDGEFRRRTQQALGSSLEYRPRHRNTASAYSPLAITPSSSYRRRSRPMLAVTNGQSDDKAKRRDREERGYRSNRRWDNVV